MEPHLNSSQIERLLQPVSNATEEGVVGRGDEIVRLHLNTCEFCQQRVRAEQDTMGRFAQLRTDTAAAKGPQCLPDALWLEVAAGIIPHGLKDHLSHAAECEHCGPILHEAIEDLAEELAPSEETQIADLGSSTAEWQRNLAAMLNGTIARSPKEKWGPAWTAVWNGPKRAVLVAAFAAMIALAVWLPLQVKPRPSARAEAKLSPQDLIANAYREKRTIEMRIEGAGYSPWDTTRGPSDDPMDRPELLTAESEIAKRLKTDPDNVVLLQASGRTSLLETEDRAPEAAVAKLEKAHRLAPENPSVTIDLASAYIKRGEAAKRPMDFGVAADLLGRVLATDPQNEVAQFNYAIALEKVPLKQQAIEAWLTFLKQHPGSPWTPDIRRDLSRLQGEVTQETERGKRALKSASEIAVSLTGRHEGEIAEIDSRIEEYQDLAFRIWLPQLCADDSRKSESSKVLQQALSGVALLLEKRHKDKWLRDILRADLNSASVRRALRLLAESEHLIELSDDDRAQKATIQALSLFRKAGISAGAERARFDLIVINQQQHRNEECASGARSLFKSRQAQAHSWILVQSEMEYGICGTMSDEHALRAVVDSVELAEAFRFPILKIRAENFASSLYEELGNQEKAWALCTNGVNEFWEKGYPNLRGYNLLANLDYLVEDRQEWFLEAAVLKETVPLIAGDPDVAKRAFQQARLGQVLLRSGDIAGSERSYEEARRLFLKVPVGSRRSVLDAEIELGLAHAELQRGLLEAAVNRLEKIRPSIVLIPEDDLQLDFFQTVGTALLQTGSLSAAQRDLSVALQLAEKGLGLVVSNNDRLKWSRHNVAIYHAMVELMLPTDPTAALAYWELFKGAELVGRGGRGLNPDFGHPPPSKVTERLTYLQSRMKSSAVVVSAVVFPRKLVLLTADSSSVRELQINIPEVLLNSMVHRFVEHCSNPASDPAAVRREGAELYEKVFLPIEPSIVGHHLLIFEPEGILGLLPLPALVDKQGAYLGDRYAITVSPGMEYVNVAKRWIGASRETKIAIVGDPQVVNWSSLPDAEEEARAVASSFAHPHVFLRRNPSDEEIEREISQAEIFHFSGHASTTIQGAGLVMGETGLFDSVKFDLASHKRNRLVVLSACSSASGATGLFDDEDSTVRSLVSQGVPDVVASRWMVDSNATSMLMKEFYRDLLGGDSVSDSLGHAMKTLRLQPRFSHPFYWASFATFGEG